jgi:hypothetical protein
MGQNVDSRFNPRPQEFGDVFPDRREGGGQVLVIDSQIFGETRRLPRAEAAAELAQVHGVKGEPCVGQVLCHVRLEEVVSPAVDVEDHVDGGPPCRRRYRPRPRGAATDEGRADVALVIRGKGKDPLLEARAQDIGRPQSLVRLPANLCAAHSLSRLPDGSGSSSP